jgi:hypothetical protein
MADRRAWRIAVHEAGHCVAGRLLGLPCGGASVELDFPHAMFARDCGSHSVCALMAGAIAETLVFGDYDRIGVEVDWKRASARMEELGVDDGGEALWAYTTELLAPHVGLIVRVSTALMDAQWLDGGEIDALLAQYLSRSPHNKA